MNNRHFIIISLLHPELRFGPTSAATRPHFNVIKIISWVYLDSLSRAKYTNKINLIPLERNSRWDLTYQSLALETKRSLSYV